MLGIRLVTRWSISGGIEQVLSVRGLCWWMSWVFKDDPLTLENLSLYPSLLFLFLTITHLHTVSGIWLIFLSLKGTESLGRHSYHWLHLKGVTQAHICPLAALFSQSPACDTDLMDISKDCRLPELGSDSYLSLCEFWDLRQLLKNSGLFPQL